MPTESESHAAIEAMYSSWIAAFERADIDAILSLLTPDYTLWSPGAPPLVGRDRVRPLLRAALAAHVVVPTFELEERFISGDLAVDVGWDVQAVQPKDGSPARVQRQRVMLVLQRDSVGAWRFARGMSQPGPAA
jgi:uncharacterized protein (TIGR02246 family)